MLNQLRQCDEFTRCQALEISYPGQIQLSDDQFNLVLLRSTTWKNTHQITLDFYDKSSLPWLCLPVKSEARRQRLFPSEGRRLYRNIFVGHQTLHAPSFLIFRNDHDREMSQSDMKTAFLYGTLDEEKYLQQPEGYVVTGKKNLFAACMSAFTV